MANFIPAYLKTNYHEGLWNKVKGDNGGETWKGIARVMHPNWKGWQIIDFTKEGMGFPEVFTKDDISKLNDLLLKNEKLELLVREFFKGEFWDKIRGDEVRVQFLADKLYDNSVNFGHTGAIKQWQKDVWNVPVTGVMDDLSLKTLNQE